MIDISKHISDNIPERVIDMANKTSEAQLRAAEKYMGKLERVFFRLHADGSDGFTRKDLIEAAAAVDESVNAYIIEAVRRRMEGWD